MLPSHPPDTSDLLSGVKWMPMTYPLWPVSRRGVALGRPASTAHRQMIEFWSPVAIVLPSREMARHCTVAVCPRRQANSLPVSGPQSLTMRS